MIADSGFGSVSAHAATDGEADPAPDGEAADSNATSVSDTVTDLTVPVEEPEDANSFGDSAKADTERSEVTSEFQLGASSSAAARAASSVKTEVRAEADAGSVVASAVRKDSVPADRPWTSATESNGPASGGSLSGGSASGGSLSGGSLSGGSAANAPLSGGPTSGGSLFGSRLDPSPPRPQPYGSPGSAGTAGMGSKEPAGPYGQTSSSGESPTAARSPRPTDSKAPRKANLQVSRFEPLSVMKFSFVMSLVCFVVLLVAVTVLYVVLSGLGVFDSISSAINGLTQEQGSKTPSFDAASWFSFTKIFGYTALIGGLNVLIITALATVWSVIYNIAADAVGGVEVTLKEAE